MAGCPDPSFQKEIKDKVDKCFTCLTKKVSWTTIGVVVAALSTIAFLCYEAYSREQTRQTMEIRENSKIVDSLDSHIKVIENELGHIKEQIKDAKDIQKISFDAIMEKLDRINERNKRRGDDGE